MRKYINTDNITLVSKQQIDIHVQLHLSARFFSYAQKCPRTVWNDILKIYNEHPVLSHTCPWLDFQSVHFGSNGLKILWSNFPHSDAHIYRHSIDLRLPLPPSSHPKLNFLVIWWLYIPTKYQTSICDDFNKSNKCWKWTVSWKITSLHTTHCEVSNSTIEIKKSRSLVGKSYRKKICEIIINSISFVLRINLKLITWKYIWYSCNIFEGIQNLVPYLSNINICRVS